MQDGFPGNWVTNTRQRIGSVLTFLMQYHTDGDYFLDQIFTGDKSWVSHIILGTKRHHSSGIIPHHWRNQTLSVQKITFFWDCKDVLVVDVMPKDTTINAVWYCGTLTKLRQVIQNCRHGMVSCSIVISSWQCPTPHTAAASRDLLDQFGWKTFYHSPRCPLLAIFMFSQSSKSSWVGNILEMMMSTQ